MNERFALTGARIFDGENWRERAALVITGSRIEGIIAADSPTDARRIVLDGGILAPGFVDLQVNGGGGVQLNATPTRDAIATICETHVQFGTTALLPTLITDTDDVLDSTIAAGIAAAEAAVPGFLGLHLEGPHLSLARKGAHDPKLIRAMTDADLDRLAAAAPRLPAMLTTVAPETVSIDQITALSEAGIVVSIGHSDATYDQAAAAVAAGASMVTHLFNAQSQLGNREPGIVGAGLDLAQLDAGLIADGLHVDAKTIAIALRAKAGRGRIFLVTDAMSLTGSELQSFMLNGRLVHRAGGALRLADGTLAGADLTLIDAVRFMHRTIGLPLAEALRMASLYPAQAMRVDASHGRLAHGALANLVHLSDDLGVLGTWVGGVKKFAA